MGKKWSQTTINRHGRRQKYELLVFVGVVTVLLTVGIPTAMLSRRSADTSIRAGAVVATGTVSSSPEGATPTQIVDSDLATYIVQLTTTPVYVAPKPTILPDLPTMEPEPTLASGINEDYPVGPFSPQEFRALNVWKGPTSNGWFMVFAGARKDPGPSDEEWPSVRVYSIATDESNRVLPGGIMLIGDFDASGATGALRIISVNDDVVHVQSEGGEVLRFNVVSLEYAP